MGLGLTQSQYPCKPKHSLGALESGTLLRLLTPWADCEILRRRSYCLWCDLNHPQHQTSKLSWIKYCVSLLVFVLNHIHWCIPDFHLKWLSCFMKDHLLYALQQYSTSRKFLIQYRPTFRKLDIKQKMKNGRSVHCNGFTCSKIVTVIFQTEKNYFLFNIVLFMFN